MNPEISKCENELTENYDAKGYMTARETSK